MATNKSIRELAGTGEELKKIDDPQLQSMVIQVLDSTPAAIANIALDETSALHTGLAYLIDNQVLNTAQYNHISRAIITSQPEKRAEQGLIKKIVRLTSAGCAGSVRTLLGWNDATGNSIDATV